MTLTSCRYLDEFPGLVHFIYVNRQFHQMTTPSFNVMMDHGNTDPTLFLKEKVETREKTVRSATRDLVVLHCWQWELG